ncbi:M23 family metallopeptidase [Desulfurispora thermophila]|uniref:M23 family metallopeptidase n=1 Tax=Desulfurispora thermophila TaxID=265470 RepID=UPI0003602F24|nr:M23 family metallopeptidase [Desulfurispora thermophila]
MKIRVLTGRPALAGALKSTLRSRLKPALLVLALISSLAGAAWYSYPALSGIISQLSGLPVLEQLAPALPREKGRETVQGQSGPAARHEQNSTGQNSNAALPAGSQTAVAPEMPPEKYILPVSGRLLGGFGMTYSPVHRDYRFSDGLDIETSPGQPVLAPAPGRVVEVRADSNLGTLHLELAGGISCRISGLKTTPLPAAGQQVFQGEVIGYTAGTVPVHIAVSKDNRAIDPGEVFDW